MISRRGALKLGAGAAGIAMTGGAALLWLNQDRDEPRTTDPERSGPASGEDDASEPSSPADTRTGIETEVGKDGFDLVFGSVRVTAPAGVAPEGTRVSVSAAPLPDLGDLATFSSAIGEPIDIVLGDHEQPAQPITLVFDFGDTDLVPGVSDETPLVAISRSSDDDTNLFLTGEWNADRMTLTVVMDHLSKVWTAILNLKDMVTGLLQDLMGMQFSKPACAYQPRTINGTTYTMDTVGDDSVWPCILQRSEEIVVELHSNSILPWGVTTRPAAQAWVPGSFNDLVPGLAAFYQGLHGAAGSQRTAIMPGNVATLRFPVDHPPTLVSLKIEPGLFLAATLLWAVKSSLTILFGGKTALIDELLDGFESFDCVTDVIVTTDEITDDQRFTGIVSSTLTCVGEQVTENAARKVGRIFAASVAAIMRVIGGGASLFVAGLLGAYRTATGTDRLAFSISAGISHQRPSASDATGDGGPSLDEPIAVRWSLERYGPRFAPPAIGDGVMYYGTQSLMHAYSLATGEVLWTNDRMASDIWQTPALADGVLYISSYMDHISQTTAHMQALDAATGNTRWEVLIRAKALFAPLYGDGMVYAESYESGRNYLYAFDAGTGDIRWTSTQGGHGVAYADGVVYTADEGMTLYALDAATGEERWRATIGEGVTSPTVADGVVYAAGRDSTLCAIDPESRELIWQFDPEDSLFSRPWITNDMIFVHSASAMHALDVRTGTERWAFDARPGQDLFDFSCVAGGVVYLTSGKQLYALDAGSGREVWRFALGDSMISRRHIAVGGGMVVVGTESAGLTALGNVRPATLGQDVVVRGAPASSGIERGAADAGTAISTVAERVTTNGETWVRVTIGTLTGWIPLSAVDPATLSPEGEIDYVYIPR